MIKNEKIKNLIKVFAGVLFVSLIMFVLNYLTPLYFDDYRYAFSFATHERLTSISQVLPSMIAHHNIMNGRFVVHFLAQVFLIMDDLMFDVINSLVFTLFIFLIYYHSAGTVKNFKLGLFFVCFLFIWMLSPGFGESFLWLTGSANYLFGPVLALLFLVPYTRYANCGMYNLKSVMSVLFACLYLVFGMVVGCTNENLALCIFGIQILFVISFFITKSKLHLWMFGGVIGNVIGTAFMFSSSTYVKRSDIWSGNSTIFDMIRNFLISISNFIEAVLFLIVAICLIIVVFYNQKKSNKNIIKESRSAIIFGMAAAAYVLSIVACDYYPDRAWPACIAFLIIVFGSLCARVEVFKTGKFLSGVLSLVVLGSFLIGSYMGVYLDLKSVKYAFDQREAVIAQALKDGEKEVALEAITTESKYSCYYGKGEINVANWMKRELANYYGFEKVTEKIVEKDVEK